MGLISGTGRRVQWCPLKPVIVAPTEVMTWLESNVYVVVVVVLLNKLFSFHLMLHHSVCGGPVEMPFCVIVWLLYK